MLLALQIEALIVALICMGQACKNNASKFDKVSFTVACLAYLVFCFVIQVVK